jgi:fatty acid amide hydrolase
VCEVVIACAPCARAINTIVVGKTKVAQLLMYVESDNPVYGRANNPWDVERSPGGSSGGEAAIIIAGGSALGLRTDIGGSVRIPAHCCGIHSLKPTPERLTVAGTVDVIGPAARAAIPDSCGLLARHVSDLSFALGVLAPAADSVPLVRDLRLGFDEDDGYFPASAAIRRAVREAAASLSDRGCHVVPFAPPDVHEALAIFYALFAADGGAEWRSQLAGGAADPRIKDLLTLASMPKLARPLASAMLRLQGQPTLATTVASTGLASTPRVADPGLGRRRQPRKDVRRGSPG